MALSKSNLVALNPVLGEMDEPIESVNDYANRVQQTLPNFPESVITQWFREHHGVIENHVGLDYPSLKFELTTFSTKELCLPCLAEHPTVVQYRDYFLQGVDSQRMSRLANYIAEHNTWPVAPLIFDNPDGKFIASWGLKYSIPYDLLEGHHRMAVLYGLRKHEHGLHQVWLVKR